MIEVSPKHQLIKLMNAIDWQVLAELILPDLKASTTKMNWWLSRKLKVHSHLGVLLLQLSLDEADRGIEGRVCDNAVYAIFCRKSAMNSWCCCVQQVI